MESMQERLEALESAVHTLNGQKQAVERQFRLWRGMAGALMLLGLLVLPLRVGKAQGGGGSQQNAAPNLEARVSALEDKLLHWTRVGTDDFITGANLHIVNGQLATGTTNGLGNLIVGYNELRGFFLGGDVRTGSHNVIVGQLHNYSSFGGLVAGRQNEISGVFASVSGGAENRASGAFSSVSGGFRNTASSDNCSVTGGQGNLASGHDCVVLGGYQNWANAFAATVSGGDTNTASGERSSVSGGSSRTAPATSNWAAGSLLQPN